MKTEITFLMELFLDEEIPKTTKLKIKDRVSEITEAMTQPGSGTMNRPRDFLIDPPPGHPLHNQSPSMQRIMAQNPDIIPKPPSPVSPAAAQALAARQALLSNASNEKPEQGRKAPRKI